MEQFLLVKMKSADPYERGIQYGEQAAELIARGIEGYRRHFRKSMAKSWEEITEKSALYLPLLEPVKAHIPPQIRKGYPELQ